MMPIETLQQGITLVVGLGKSGLSMVRCLQRLGADIVVVDSREQPPGLAELQAEFSHIPYYLGAFQPELFARTDRIALSPGVALSTPEIAAAQVPVFGDIELFSQLAQAPIAAITGSNGKSTVTTLLGQMAQTAGIKTGVGGNLGPPALDLLNSDTELYILELSSFQLETTTSLVTKAACVLNISPDHMDRYADYRDYIRAKQRIFQQAETQILNADDAEVAAMANPAQRQIWFGARAGQAFGLLQRSDGLWLGYKGEPWINAYELKITGLHNYSNALAALALGTALNLPRIAMLQALRQFSGLPHRGQLIAEHQGVRWYNDSKATNVGATIAAVQGMLGAVVLIAGGEGKGQDFSPLRPALKDKVRSVILIGKDRNLIAQALGSKIDCQFADGMAQAVARARELAQSGDTVLLSPACASFDMFKNYEHRGAVFSSAVQQLFEDCYVCA